MSIEKTALRAGVISEVGNKLEDQFEAAKGEFREAKGIHAGVDVLARRIEGYSKGLDAGVAEDPPKLPREEYEIAKKHVAVLHQMAVEMSRSTMEGAYRAQGKVAAMEQTVKLTKNLLDHEETKLKAFRDGSLVEEDSGLLPGAVPGQAEVVSIRGRQEGQHPGNPVAMFRARDAEQQSLKKRGRRKKPDGPDA